MPLQYISSDSLGGGPRGNSRSRLPPRGRTGLAVAGTGGGGSSCRGTNTLVDASGGHHPRRRASVQLNLGNGRHRSSGGATSPSTPHTGSGSRHPQASSRGANSLLHAPPTPPSHRTGTSQYASGSNRSSSFGRATGSLVSNVGGGPDHRPSSGNYATGTVVYRASRGVLLAGGDSLSPLSGHLLVISTVSGIPSTRGINPLLRAGAMVPPIHGAGPLNLHGGGNHYRGPHGPGGDSSHRDVPFGGSFGHGGGTAGRGSDASGSDLLHVLEMGLRREFVDHFASSLPRVSERDLASLGESDSLCSICLTPFLDIISEEKTATAMGSMAHFNEELGVTRLVQTCGHFFCRKDIIKWLYEGNMTCPTCRTPFTATSALERRATSRNTSSNAVSRTSGEHDRAAPSSSRNDEIDVLSRTVEGLDLLDPPGSDLLQPNERQDRDRSGRGQGDARFHCIRMVPPRDRGRVSDLWD